LGGAKWGSLAGCLGPFCPPSRLGWDRRPKGPPLFLLAHLFSGSGGSKRSLFLGSGRQPWLFRPPFKLLQPPGGGGSPLPFPAARGGLVSQITGLPEFAGGRPGPHNHGRPIKGSENLRARWLGPELNGASRPLRVEQSRDSHPAVSDRERGGHTPAGVVGVGFRARGWEAHSPCGLALADRQGRRGLLRGCKRKESASWRSGGTACNLASSGKGGAAEGRQAQAKSETRAGECKRRLIPAGNQALGMDATNHQIHSSAELPWP